MWGFNRYDIIEMQAMRFFQQRKLPRLRKKKEVVKQFTDRFDCVLTVAENSDHPFMGEGDGQIVEQWLQDNV